MALRSGCSAGLVALLLAVAAVGCLAAPPARLSHFLAEAAGMEDWLIRTRRLFHGFPELFFQEHNTSATIRRHLDELGIKYQ